jgi:lipoate-protein ligase A
MTWRLPAGPQGPPARRSHDGGRRADGRRDAPHDEGTKTVRLRKLPDLTACGAVQMAVDDGLLDDAIWTTVRRYRWSPPTLSLGKFQRLPGVADVDDVPEGLPFDVVRRPSGGRAVLHGADFEWSFAVVFPPAARGSGSEGRAAGVGIGSAYEIVSAAMADGLTAAGVHLAEEREEPYRRSALCFATSLRHDLHVQVGKVVAVAQVRRDGATLVHGSVLERRPPTELTAAVERLVGEPWRGEGLDAGVESIDAGVEGVDAEALWLDFLDGLEDRLA